MPRSYLPAVHEVLTPAMRHPPADPACHFSCLPSTLHLKMQSHADQARLLHRITIALSQLHRLLQQATDILANLHSLYLVHTRQVDGLFPPAPITAVPVPSPTSSCDSAPTAPIKHAPPQPPISQASSTSTSQPPPPPRRNANLHHPSKRVLIGMPGMATLKFALWNSKLTPACDPIGTMLLVEWVSQLHSVKHAGKNFKKHNANTKQSSHRLHQHLLPPPTRHHLFPLFTHLLLQQPSHHCHHLQLRTSLTLLQHLHHLYRPPQPLTMLCQQPSVRTVIRNQADIGSYFV